MLTYGGAQDGSRYPGGSLHSKSKRLAAFGGHFGGRRISGGVLLEAKNAATHERAESAVGGVGHTFVLICSSENVLVRIHEFLQVLLR